MSNSWWLAAGAEPLGAEVVHLGPYHYSMIAQLQAVYIIHDVPVEMIELRVCNVVSKSFHFEYIRVGTAFSVAIAT